MKQGWLVVGLMGLAGALVWFGWPRSAVAPDGSGADQMVESVSKPEMTENVILPTTAPSEEMIDAVEPVENFKARVTKKPFGIYITPEDSPVQPERFTGFHTGADVEYADTVDDVPVWAVADGTVLSARVASGYGGVVAIRHVIDGEKVIGIYGHVRPNSWPEVGSEVARGEQIGVLGMGETVETDGERKHLHFGLVKGTMVDLRGYVETQSALFEWIDPLTIFD